MLDQLTPDNASTVTALMTEARTHTAAMKAATVDAIKAAIEAGRRFEMIRALFPPRSGWEAWLAQEFSCSPRTIHRLRALSRLFYEDDGTPRPDRFQALRPDLETGIATLYQLATSNVPADAVNAAFAALRDGDDLSKSDADDLIRRTRQSAQVRERYPQWARHLEEHDPGVVLKAAQALRAIGNAPVRELIVARGVMNTALYEYIDALYIYETAEFESLVATGYIYSPLVEQTISIHQAGPSDLAANIRYSGVDRFLEGLGTLEDWQTDNEEKGDYLATLRGRRDEVAAALPPDEDIIVVVYRRKNGARMPIVRLTPGIN